MARARASETHHTITGRITARDRPEEINGRDGRRWLGRRNGGAIAGNGGEEWVRVGESGVN